MRVTAGMTGRRKATAWQQAGSSLGGRKMTVWKAGRQAMTVVVAWQRGRKADVW